MDKADIGMSKELFGCIAWEAICLMRADGKSPDGVLVPSQRSVVKEYWRHAERVVAIKAASVG